MRYEIRESISEHLKRSVLLPRDIGTFIVYVMYEVNTITSVTAYKTKK